MNLKFYKPNKNNTGAACSVSFNNYSESLYIEMIKQATWDDSKKRGTFNKSSKLLAKFSINEIGSMLDVIGRNIEWKIFHNSDKGTTSGTFSPYINKGGTQLGYSLSMFQKDAANSENNRSVRIGFTFAEAEVLKQFFVVALQEYSRKLMKQSEEYGLKRYNESKNNQQQQNKPSGGWDDWSDVNPKNDNAPKFNGNNDAGSNESDDLGF